MREAGSPDRPPKRGGRHGSASFAPAECPRALSRFHADRSRAVTRIQWDWDPGFMRARSEEIRPRSRNNARRIAPNVISHRRGGGLRSLLPEC
jgi:hypothetical protein